VRASDVTVKPVTWLHYPYVPLGKITAIAGATGQAKSLWTCWLAADVTNAGGAVIMLNAEDDAEDTIVPRLRAAGAVLDRVWIEPDVWLNRERLEEIAAELGDVRLITIDPIAAYLPGNVNSWKAQDVRRELDPFRHLAADWQLAVVLVQHLNRRSDERPAIADRGFPGNTAARPLGARVGA
jgi:putative DNA primase/helicase